MPSEGPLKSKVTVTEACLGVPKVGTGEKDSSTCPLYHLCCVISSHAKASSSPCLEVWPPWSYYPSTC